MTESIKELFGALDEDAWRRSNPFSTDIELAHRVLFHPYASYGEKEKAIALWLQGKDNQPCLFGRIAAVDALHFCILDDLDLSESDDHIKTRLSEALLAWKRRSVDPARSKPAHGFVVALVSPRLAYAAPNKALLKLATAFRDLWGCAVEKDDAGNDIAVETLYLRDPQDQHFRFTFSIDYFGAQGDGRWWHDHRFPGGIAFTANSAGHMIHSRRLYGGMEKQIEWLLQTAMLTIDASKKTAFGRATWLRDLADGKPFVQSACPFASGAMRPQLVGKDWTRYAGHLYSDHSVRKEFFRDAPEKPAEFLANDWLEDFVYLYEPAALDHARFVAGEPVNHQEVVDKLGDPASWRFIAPQRGGYLRASSARTSIVESEIAKALLDCERWGLSAEDHRSISDP